MNVESTGAFARPETLSTEAQSLSPIRRNGPRKRIDHVLIIAENLHNLGDLALLLQCAEGLRERSGIRHTAVRQWNDTPRGVIDDLFAAGIELVRGKNLARIMARSAGALVVVGGGQAVRDNAGLSSLLNLLIAVRCARVTGGASAILGCGVDRLKSRPHRWLWAAILRGAGLVTVRDGASQAAVADLAPRAYPMLTADLMFMPSALHQRLLAAEVMTHIVIAPCVDASEGRSVGADRLAMLAGQACDAAGLRRVCIVAQDARSTMDMRIVPEVAAAIARRRPDLSVEIVAGHRLDDALRAYAASRLTITNRLHPAIFSLIAQRPVLIVEDGTAKLNLIARRFALECVANDADRIPADILQRLRQEMTDGPSPRRRRLVEEAKTDAVANFDMLARKLGQIMPPPQAEEPARYPPAAPG